ncbi:hypothetical protein JVU11DRAFT_1090 [Chiua virens]|nr:hypothetical protein JVU11DRAFT_1090 [Chiua virens]
MRYYSPTHKVLDYFKVANMLINDMLNKAPHPRCTFVSGTTAIHLAIKPHHRMTIEEATTLFELLTSAQQFTIILIVAQMA